jgi:hypothetical protein
VLQPDLLQRVLTSCTGLTQLQLTGVWIDDQGLEVLLTHGTSITDLTWQNQPQYQQSRLGLRLAKAESLGRRTARACLPASQVSATASKGIS